MPTATATERCRACNASRETNMVTAMNREPWRYVVTAGCGVAYWISQSDGFSWWWRAVVFVLFILNVLSDGIFIGGKYDPLGQRPPWSN